MGEDNVQPRSDLGIADHPVEGNCRKQAAVVSAAKVIEVEMASIASVCIQAILIWGGTWYLRFVVDLSGRAELPIAV